MVLEQIANLSAGLIRLRGSSPRRSAKIFRGCSSFGRAVALQAIGSKFDPCHLHQVFYAGLAQLVERVLAKH